MSEVEPIPFYGWSIVDSEDTETMLREQIHMLQAECNRLRRLIIEHGIEDI